MAITLKIVYRKDKMNAQGLAPIHIRLTKNRKISYIVTDLRLEEKYWDFKSCRVKPNYTNSIKANNYIYGLFTKYQAEVWKDKTTNVTTSVKALKDNLIREAITSFADMAQILLKRYKSNNKIGTHDTFLSTVNKVTAFAKTDRLSLQEIDTRFLSRYEEYLRDELGNKPNTIHKDLKILRRIFNTAYKQGFIAQNQSPFNRYELKTEKTIRDHLTENEVELLEHFNAVPGSRLDLHRDMFVFSCYAGGLRVSDVLLLQWSNFDGTHIHFKIRKTEDQHALKLPDAALAIVNKYITSSEDKRRFIFPMLPADLDLENYLEVDRKISGATAYINKNLKIIASRSGIKKNLHFHISRHTFCCIALKKGLGMEFVSRLVGHSSIRQTQVYAKLVSNELDAAMDKFNL